MDATVERIPVQPGTKRLLRRLEARGDTYDDIIRRLVAAAATKRLDARWNKILAGDRFVPFEEL